jgi:hypothetical protein
MSQGGPFPPISPPRRASSRPLSAEHLQVFPLQGGAFVSKLNAGGSALLYSTYLGGSNGDDSTGIAGRCLGRRLCNRLHRVLRFFPRPRARSRLLGGGAFVGIKTHGCAYCCTGPFELDLHSAGRGDHQRGQKVQLSNAGTKALNITSIVASGDFTQTNNCPGTVALDGFCTLSVTFTCTATEIRTGPSPSRTMRRAGRTS